jgi:hypothetical protein
MSNASPQFKIITTSSYDNTSPPNRRNSIAYLPADVDLLRYRLGNVYNSSGEFIQSQVNNSPSVSYKIKQINIDSSNPLIDKELLTIEPFSRDIEGAFSNTTDPSSNYNLQPTINNWINSIRPQTNTPNPTDVVPLQGNITNGKVFIDLTTNFNFAVDKKYSQINSSQFNAASVNVKYNYYNRAYENVSAHTFVFSGSTGLSPFKLTERLLPSYIAFDSVIDDTYEGQFLGMANPEAVNHITLYSERSSTNLDSEKLGKALNTGFGTKVSLKSVDYFTEYSNSIYNLLTSSNFSFDFGDLSATQFNVILPPPALSSHMNDTKDLLSDMPMYTEVTFDRNKIQTGSPFETIISTITDFGLWSSLITYFNQDFQKNQKSSFNIDAKAGLPFAPDNFFNGIVEAEGLNVMNFEDFWDNAPEFLNSMSQIDYQTFVGGKGNSLDYTYIEGFGQRVVVEALQSYAKQNFALMYEQMFRSYQDILDGSYAQNGVLYYKVEKWEVDANDNPVLNVQNFFLPNTGDEEFLKLFDTQVKYGKKYIYRIYALTLIVGTSYRYQINDITGINDYNNDPRKLLESEICVFPSPSMKLVSVPYYQKKIVISDKPPIFPDISVYPYRGDKNRVVFLLKSNVGSTKEVPVILKEQDQELFDNILENMELSQNSKIEFSSDDPSILFDVFRLDTKPKSYADFSSADYKQINAGEFDVPCKQAAAASTVEFLEPNRKYYYTFRSIDIHGNVSNPTPIYEIEISYDGASPFLLTNVFSFEGKKTPTQKPIKKAKKYIRIRPAYQQTILNEQATGIFDEEGNFTSPLNFKNQPDHPIVLGSEDESLWGKTFKIRVISKKSGKKIDLNVKFENKRAIIDGSETNNLC